MLQQISSNKFTEWMAFGQLEPFGPRQDDRRAGMLASVLANIYRAEGQEPYTERDFMPCTPENRPDESGPDFRVLMAKMGTLIKPPTAQEP
jgi:hypothetical protein